MKEIGLGGKIAAGRVALVDDEDFELVSPYRWRAIEDRRKRRVVGPYAVAWTPMVNGLRTCIRMHQLVTGFKWSQVDHMNHETLDNQKFNLRDGSGGVNARNARPWLGSSSQYKGVHWDAACSEWRVLINLGGFTTEEEAARAYDELALAAWGEAAWLNFPKDPGRHPKAALLNLELDNGGSHGTPITSPVSADHRRRGKRR
jgi:hypothetical protein